MSPSALPEGEWSAVHSDDRPERIRKDKLSTKKKIRQKYIRSAKGGRMCFLLRCPKPAGAAVAAAGFDHGANPCSLFPALRALTGVALYPQ